MKKIYGKLLYKISPKKLIEKGWITDIKLHIAEFETEDREASFVDEISQEITINKKLSSKLPYFKILVATPGTKYIDKIEKKY